MRTHRILAVGLATAVGLGALAATPALGQTWSKPRVPASGIAVQHSFERETLRQINVVRRARGLRPLRQARALRLSARRHTVWMARKRKLSHTGVRGSAFWQRIIAAGYPRNRRMSEVIGMRNVCLRGDPRIIVREWLRSPSHRVLVLDRKVRYMGVAVVSTAKCRQTYYTANFGS